MATITRSPMRVALGPTVFAGSVHVRACASADAQRTVLSHYVGQLDKLLRKLHSVRRWHLVAHETAADAFSITVTFERAQIAARLDNVAAGFIRMLTISVAAKAGDPRPTEYTMRRRAWTDCGHAGFIFTDCVPAPEGSYSAAVSSALAEARLQAKHGTVRELSSTMPPMLTMKPRINQPAPSTRGQQAGSSMTAAPRPPAAAGH